MSSEDAHRRALAIAREATKARAGVSDAVLQQMAEWKASAIARANLFRELSSVPRSGSDFARAFVYPDRFVSVVESLQAQAPEVQLMAPSVIGGRLALDSARPLAHFDRPNSLGNVGQQLAVLNESLSQLAMRPDETLRQSVVETVVNFTQAFAESWRPFIADMAKAVEQCVDRQRELDERTHVFVRRHGWPLPTSIPDAAYHRVV